MVQRLITFCSGEFNSPDVPFDWYFVGGGAWAEWKDDFGARLPLGISGSSTTVLTFMVRYI